jgi:hypothetical protein
MAMEFLAFHNQFVSDFLSNDQQDNLVPLHILQGTQISRTEFKLG